ncbi:MULTISPECIES: flagellar basal-body MS-ring/collar protein FliF [Halobacteriovorax]|uniref:Flagellar M-ring protein n=1 Tax=Halobacteriovorax vibrionivorans TaxID=2152716 RepID=A0ABY0II50_9BACT|nr:MULTISPECIES: flagellar basal-body MS-ring/collar protein FliF [Halobacteriovorax]RZF22637.1 flagellar M-ring protein FliF [Halobacteriovorax vibrionivorans]TGD45766.1 flagellar M-ring protein FliF [Halobacteriovorax sp. Y22]
MKDFFDKMLRNFKEFYGELDAGKKISLFAVTGVILVFLLGVVLWATHTNYKVLYSDLNKEDMTKVEVFLSQNNVEKKTSADGRTVSIPEDMIETVRLKMMTSGFSFSGTVGYEVFDNQSFGTTSFVQKVNKQRALEGELIKTIKHLRGVKRARVHLNIPESSPFVSEKKPPSASVVLELNRGVTLTEQEIKGISSLVASSVEGMRPTGVVILDHRGKKLSENIGDAMTANTANRLALESKLNRKYEAQIEDILTKVVGAGKVIAKVSVDMDFTESVSTQTSYDSENKAVLSEVTNTQNLQGSRPSPQGIPGARSNLPGEQPQPGVPETRNDVKKELATRNYNVPKKVTRSKSPTASVRKISAAVMLDGKRVTQTVDGKTVTKYEPWSEADIANFQAIVASTLGIDDRRGDVITIKNMEFQQEDLEAIDALMRERENRELIKNIFKYLAIGLTISLFFFVVVRPFIQWVTDNAVETVEDFLPRTLEELEKVQANQKLPGLEDALPQIEEKLNPEKIEGNMLREKIISLVETNPGKAAQIVHDMIHAQESDKSIA